MPRFLWREFRGTDVHFHYYYIDLIKRNGHRLPRNEPRIVGGTNDCTYPSFYHWLLSYLPPKALHYVDVYSGFFFDAATGGIICFLLRHTTLIEHKFLLYVFGLYLISPGLTFSFLGPRAYSLTPRNFAQFLYGLAALSWLGSSYFDGRVWGVWIGASVACFAALLLTSQFGLQVVLFLFILFIFKTYASLAAVIVSAFGAAAIASKGFLIRQIGAQWDHLAWYCQYNYGFVTHRGNWRKLWATLQHRRWRELVYEAVFFNPILVGLNRHPTIFLSVAIYFMRRDQISHSIISAAIGFLGVALFSWIITGIGRLRVLGEAERYLEFAYPIQWLAFWSLIPSTYCFTAIIGLSIYFVLFYAYNLYQLRAQLGIRGVDELGTIAPMLNNPQYTILCLNNNETYYFLRNTSAKLVGFLVNISLRGNFRVFFERFFSHYPYVEPDRLIEICREHGVTHIVCNKSARLTMNVRYQKDYNFSNFKLLSESGNYLLYES